MDALVPDTRTALPPSHHGTRYGADTRDAAYQLWAFKHGRNAEAAARELGEECPGLEGRTVRRWAAEGGWAERVEREVVALAPAVHRATVVDLIAGAGEAAAYLRAAVRGEQRAEAARVNAAVALLDRAGFGPPPGGRLEPDPPPGVAAEAAGLGVEELLRRRLARLEQAQRPALP